MASSPAQPTTNVPQTFATFITNAFSIVAALAWSDALTNFFKHYDVFKTYPLAGPFLYACFITLVAYVVWRTLGKVARPAVTPTPLPARGSS